MQVLHDRLLDKVLSLPMSFFDTQPSGRLCNRFTRDVEATDVSLQSTINSFTTCSTSVTLSTLVIAGVTRGAVLLAMAPLVFVYRSIQQYYLATSRELKRLDSISMSPIFSNFGETLNGLMTIRAFRKQVPSPISYYFCTFPRIFDLPPRSCSLIVTHLDMVFMLYTELQLQYMSTALPPLVC